MVHLVLLGTDASLNDLADEDNEQYIHMTQYNYNDENQDKNVFKMTDFQLLKYVQTEITQGSHHADIMDGLILGIHLFSSQFAKLKVAKKIYILSDLSSVMDISDSSIVKSKIDELDIAVSLIAFDAPNTIIRQKNDSFFKSEFLPSVQGAFFTFQEAQHQLLKPYIKSVRQVTTFRGDIVIPFANEESVNISIFAYNKTSLFKVDSAKRYNPSDHLDSSVHSASHFYCKSEFANVEEPETLTFVNEQDIGRAFPYGKGIYPIPEIEESTWKYTSDKGMTCLGFVYVKDIPRHYLMGNVMLIIPTPGHPQSTLSFTALLNVLESLDAVALIRYVRTQNSNPKIGILFPDLQTGAGNYIQIPYKDYIRKIALPLVDPSLYNPEWVRTAKKKSKLDSKKVDSLEAKAAVEKLVDSMTLSSSECVMYNEAVNPLFQRQNDWCIHKILFPLNSDFPPTCSSVLNGIQVTDRIIRNSMESLNDIKSCFTVQKVPEKKKKHRVASIDPPQGFQAFKHSEIHDDLDD